MKRFFFYIILVSCFHANGQGSLKEVFLQSKMDGELTLFDGTEIVFWGYGIENQTTGMAKISLPGPTLRFDLGDTARIQLRNTSPEAHTIHWHGLDVDQANDGVGHTSSNVIPNALFTYEFVCSEPGTYMYHCHVLTPLHLAMGMYGLVIVGGEAPEQLYDSTTKYTKEFSFLFSEMNLSWNTNPMSPGPFALYEADYLMVNGMSDQELEFSDNTVVASENDTLAFRMANIGYGSVRAIFPPELEVYAVASDGRRVIPMETNELEIFPGERFDFIARPLQAFDGVIMVDYIDLRNNNLLGSNDISVIVTSTVGLTNEALSTSSVYPNPFTESVHIESEEYPATIDVLDNTGKLLKRLTVTSASEVDLHDLARGSYSLRIGADIFKIIKR